MSVKTPKKIVLFASGSGSNVENISDFFSEDPRVVISGVLCNNPGAGVVDRCKRLKLPRLLNLKNRLKRRRYSAQKIADNLEAEAFDTCAVEAEELGHDVLRVDTSKPVGFEKLKLYIQKKAHDWPWDCLTASRKRRIT